MNKIFIYFALFLLLAVKSFCVPPSVSLGVGALNVDSPYRGAGDDTIIFPLVEVNYVKLYFNKKELGYVAFSDETTKFSIYADFWDGYSVDGSDLSAGYDRIDDRNRQIIGGMRVSYDPDYYYLYDIKLSASVGIGEKGNKISFAVSKPETYLDDRLAVVPTLSLNILNDNYTDYYFGVDDDEAFINTKIGEAYEGETAYTLNALLAAQYSLDDFWSLSAYMGLEYLGEEINDSPIVSDEFIYTLGTGVQYKF